MTPDLSKLSALDDGENHWIHFTGDPLRVYVDGNLVVVCEECFRELDPENAHDDDGATKCFEHCSLCQRELADDWRLGLLSEVLIVLVLIAWAILAPIYAGRGGASLEPRVSAGPTSTPVIFTGETGP